MRYRFARLVIIGDVLLHLKLKGPTMKKKYSAENNCPSCGKKSVCNWNNIEELIEIKRSGWPCSECGYKISRKNVDELL
jgi:Zn ribbon nucleic-acid-binding protein